MRRSNRSKSPRAFRSESQIEESNVPAARRSILTSFNRLSSFDNFSSCDYCATKKVPIPTCKHGRILVSFNPNLFSVVKIDDSSETVTLDIGLTFEWHDKHLAEHVRNTSPGACYASHPHILRLENQSTEPWPDNKNPGTYFFDPAWKVKGASATEVLRTITTMKDASSGHVHQFVQCLVTYPLKMDLKEFPFDSQKITCEILTEHTIHSMQFIPDTERVPKIFGISNSEWSILPDPDPAKKNQVKTTFTEADKDKEQLAGSGRVYAQCSFSFEVKRRSGWYIWNLFLVSFLIVFASFSTFTMKTKETDPLTNKPRETQDLANRLQIVFTAWLLLISLKFVISDRLPKINYLTSLDKYFLLSNNIMLLLIGYFSSLQVRLNDDVIHDFTMDDFLPIPLWISHIQSYIPLIHSMGPEGIVMLFFISVWIYLHIGYLNLIVMGWWKGEKDLV